MVDKALPAVTHRTWQDASAAVADVLNINQFSAMNARRQEASAAVADASNINLLSAMIMPGVKRHQQLPVVSCAAEAVRFLLFLRPQWWVGNTLPILC